MSMVRLVQLTAWRFSMLMPVFLFLWMMLQSFFEPSNVTLTHPLASIHVHQH